MLCILTNRIICTEKKYFLSEQTDLVFTIKNRKFWFCKLSGLSWSNWSKDLLWIHWLFNNRMKFWKYHQIWKFWLFLTKDYDWLISKIVPRSSKHFFMIATTISGWFKEKIIYCHVLEKSLKKYRGTKNVVFAKKYLIARPPELKMRTR